MKDCYGNQLAPILHQWPFVLTVADVAWGAAASAACAVVVRLMAR